MPPSNPLPSSQRAVQCISPDARQATVSQEAPIPPIPKSGIYTLVRVLSSSLNPVDYKILSLPQPIPRLALGSSPITPAADFVGRVWQTTHPDLKAGDLCWGKLPGPTKYGTCAEFTLHKGEHGIAKVPEGYLPLTSQGRSLEELGGMGIAGLTALQALKSADLPYNRSNGEQTGGKVFINGASGGTGTYTVQMAKAMGCDTVVASCSAANSELVKNLGVDEVIDYRSQDVVESLKQWSKRNGGQAFDAIIDNVGNPDIYWNSHHYLKSSGGKYITVGTEVSWKGLVDNLKMSLWPRWLGGGQRPFQLFMLGATPKEEWELIGKWMVEGKVRTIIEDENRFDLSDIRRAFEKLQTGRTRGKIIITVAEDGQ